MNNTFYEDRIYMIYNMYYDLVTETINIFVTIYTKPLNSVIRIIFMLIALKRCGNRIRDSPVINHNIYIVKSKIRRN